MMKNWLGYESHPSDCLIHWNSVPNREARKQCDEEVRQLRADWDLLTATNEGKAAMTRLLQAQHDYSTSDQSDEHVAAINGYGRRGVKN